ncbi:hypothetical protein [Pedobacter antarcticus]|uniref:Uncharacterized protein n=2 Tax=Pedobacter antarcticus TaxID=34086 RepID=A0A081PIL6_9SPHI|nr:hypothetical protein [Pedobacter antarcticus]KEQ30539.1 hypothetical protein N180_12795 [Pedobacter antarcticus 4BY]SDL77476.1 hypothetical protein SAMN04488084_102413 [Pedobacter antarcticus]SFF26369.1 hypothetical protein SAMN03003324_03084 [Pedobacter antarcticus]
MNKADVELVVITVKSGIEEALSLKVYKNGTLARRGSGGLPGVKISGMSLNAGPGFFLGVMNSVSQQVLDSPVNYEEEITKTALEYQVSFYGQSSNGDQGERAEWTQSVTLRFFMDEGTMYRNQLLGFVDGLAIEAMKLTDSWYFDLVMLALEGKRSSVLPEHTIVSNFKNEDEAEAAFQAYFQQVNKKQLPEFVKDKVFTDPQGLQYKLLLQMDDQSLTYTFEPAGVV